MWSIEFTDSTSNHERIIYEGGGAPAHKLQCRLSITVSTHHQNMCWVASVGRTALRATTLSMVYDIVRNFIHSAMIATVSRSDAPTKRGPWKRGTKRRGGRIVQAKRLEKSLEELGINVNDLQASRTSNGVCTRVPFTVP